MAFQAASVGAVQPSGSLHSGARQKTCQCLAAGTLQLWSIFSRKSLWCQHTSFWSFDSSLQVFNSCFWSICTSFWSILPSFRLQRASLLFQFSFTIIRVWREHSSFWQLNSIFLFWLSRRQLFVWPKHTSIWSCCLSATLLLQLCRIPSCRSFESSHASGQITSSLKTLHESASAGSVFSFQQSQPAQQSQQYGSQHALTSFGMHRPPSLIFQVSLVVII